MFSTRRKMHLKMSQVLIVIVIVISEFIVPFYDVITFVPIGILRKSDVAV